MKKEARKRCYCYKCGNETNQEIAYKTSNFDTNAIYSSGADSEIGWVVEKTDWSFSSCKGCDSKNLEITTYHSGANEIEREVSRTLIPGKTKKRVEDWIFRLDTKYIELLSEVYSAFNNGCFRLSMMGARTIIDIFIVEKIGDKGGFKQKLQSLLNEKYINTHQHELLETSIEAGNASSHRGYNPSEKILTSVIDIIEHLLKPIAMQLRVSNLKNEIPQREKT